MAFLHAAYGSRWSLADYQWPCCDSAKGKCWGCDHLLCGQTSFKSKAFFAYNCIACYYNGNSWLLDSSKPLRRGLVGSCAYWARRKCICHSRPLYCKSAFIKVKEKRQQLNICQLLPWLYYSFFYPQYKAKIPFIFLLWSEVWLLLCGDSGFNRFDEKPQRPAERLKKLQISNISMIDYGFTRTRQ